MVKMLSCNAQGLCNNNKRREFFYYFHERNLDIVFVQETHCSRAAQGRWKMEWGGPIYFSNGTTASRGVAVLFDRKFQYQLINVKHDDNGRWIEVRIKYEGSELTLLNVYAPNIDDPEFFKTMFHSLRQMDPREIILAGDFNLVLDIELDKMGGRKVTHWNSQKIVKAYMEELNLVDIWRIQHPEAKIFTWKGVRGIEEIRVRLDFFLISDTLAQFVSISEIKPRYKADHALPLIEINLIKLQRGRGVWKFNTSLLSVKEFLESINEMIEEEILTEYESARHRWEIIKMRARSIAIKVSSEKKRDREQRLKILEKKLKLVEEKNEQAYTTFWNPQEIQEHKLRLHREIEEIIEYRTRGAAMRCKVNWLENGNKPTKYFSGLEKSKYNRKTITKLKDNQGVIQSSNEDIQAIQVNFFKKLYANKDLDCTKIDEFFNDLQGPKLSNKQRLDLELPVNIGELSKAVKEMQNSKTPGPDGFSVEFYKCFWGKLRKPLWEAMKESWKFGFDRNMQKSLITLLGKKERDPLEIENWRPINLLNVDYKIISKALANRVRDILPFIIDDDQKGFIPGRYIGENIRDLIDTVDFCDKNQVPSLLISFDYKRAFDSINHLYFDKTLEFFGFGPIFRQYMKSLYEGVEVAILNNGHISQYLPVQSGFRQGCVLSPGNFVIALQPLILKIKQAQNVQGIQLSDALQKLFGLFADDIWATIFGDQNNLNALLSHFDRFAQVSGLHINYNKTQIMRIGSLRNSNAIFYTQKPLNWAHSVKILGIRLGSREALYSNYQGILENIQQITAIWSNRSLNVFGKIVICNSLLLSIPVYKLLMVSNPDTSFFVKVKKTIVEFLWDGKPSKVRYSKMIKSKWSGGLSLTDLAIKNLSLKASWVPRLILARNATWSFLAYSNLPFNSELIWECNISSQTILRMFDKDNFWIQVWAAWADLKGQDEPTSCDEVLLQVLWYNCKILRRGKPWIASQFSRVGINKVQDIYDETNSMFFTYDELCTRFNQHLNIMDYNAIIVGIPSSFKSLLNRRSNMPVRRSFLEIALSKKKPSQYLSKLAKNRITDSDGCKEAWQHDLSCTIEDEKWNSIIVDQYLLTNFDQLRWFQYRIIHRLLVTNVKRNKYDRSVSDKCQFCQHAKETPMHLLVECRTTQKFWFAWQKWIKYFFKIQVELDPFVIIFNQYSGQFRPLINTMILIAKQHIYASKCMNVPLRFNTFAQRLAQICNIEKTVALRNGKIDKHDKKWRLYQEI